MKRLLVATALMLAGAQFVPAQFLSEETRKEVFKNVGKDENYVYSEPEVWPEYPGGDKALLTELNDSIVYPQKARELGIHGRVVIRFVVTKDGTVERARVVKSKNPLLDAEAVRVAYTLKKFTPGKVKGKAVNCWFTVPVTFKL